MPHEPTTERPGATSGGPPDDSGPVGRLSRAGRWRVVGLSRKATWLYRGVRWRVVGLSRKATWLYRGVRWRVVGLSRKATWLYRGVRWRVIGQLRRFQWFLRRQRPRMVGRARRLAWASRRWALPVVGTMRRRTAPLVRGISNPRRATAAVVGLRSQRAVRDESVARFVELVDRLEPEGSSRRWGWWRRLRTSRALLRAVPRPVDCALQVIAIGGDVDWDRDPGIADARFVLVDDDVTQPTLRELVPALISGRPIASRGPARVVGGPNTLTTVFELDAYRMNESELALAANRQIRELFGVTAPSADVEPPTISVVMATNRPEWVPHAVEQIQAQRFVEVELLIGLHGSSVEDVPAVELELGAVTSATMTSFSADTVFGDVLQSLSSAATGRFVSKWDDDDLYGPHHLVDLWLFSGLTQSPLVGKAAEFVLLESEDLLVRRRGGQPYTQTRFLAGGALMMSSAALRAVGGWGSVPRSVDQELIERFERNGLRTTRIHGYEFVLVRHGRGHTWAADSSYFLESAQEAWTSGAIELAGLGRAGPSVRVPAAVPCDDPAASPQAVRATVCVPNKDGVDSFWLWRHRAAEWPDAIDLVVSDDRSDPPLQADPTDDRVGVVRVPVADGFGAGRARHCAATHAGGDVLFFVDADVDVDDSVFVELLARFEAGYRGAIHGAIEFAAIDSGEARRLVERHGIDRMRSEVARRGIPGQVWRERHWAASADLRAPRSSSYRATVGAFLAVDAETYRRSGGFRDVDIRGVEDIEFGYRLLVSGCTQSVYRGGGIVHLGERTFSAELEAAEALERETRLSAFVPIWSRSLEERRRGLSEWSDDVAPFVWIPDGIGAELNDRHGPGTAMLDEWDGAVPGAPFAVGLDVVPRYAAAATDAAYRAFRRGRGGEVVVVVDGDPVARFVATWAVNVARRRLGLDVEPATVGPDWCPADVTADLRRCSGTITTSI